MKNKRMWLLLLLFTAVLFTGCAITDSGNSDHDSDTDIGMITDKNDSENDSENNDTQNSPQNDSEPEPGDTPAPPEDPEPEPEPIPEPEIIDITIHAVGDITLGTNQKMSYDRSFHEYYDTYGADYFLQNVRELFESDDFTIGNLEGTLTTSDNIRSPKEWNHKGKPEYISVLTGSSVEAVSLGNNHIMDYQMDGVNDTLQTVSDAGIAYGLSGEWGNEYGMYETEKGIKIGFVSVNEYYEGDTVYPYLEEGLATLRENGTDLVFACTHWGEDKTHIIDEDQYEMGRWCIDQGYDLVLGCHPHVLQGIECYKGKYIVYSMGNFCYGGNKNPAEKDSMIWEQTFTFVDGVLQEETTVKAIPCRLSSSTNKNDYCPEILTGDEAAAVIENLNGYSAEFGLVLDVEGNLIECESQ